MSAAAGAPPAEVVEAWRVKRSLGRAWGFTLASFGLWGAYWVYTTRKLLDREIGHGRDDAVFHTVGVFVPVLNFFVAYWMWRDINWLRQRIGLPGFEVGLWVGLTVIGAAPITYSLALNRLNEYWDWRSQGWATDAPVTGGEIALAAVGVVWMAGWIALYVLLILLAITA